MNLSVTRTPNITYKVFTFEDGQESVSVSVPEVLDPQYGLYVWPCAVVLAQYVWTQRERLRGRSLLELGAGVGLPGVLAACCGARVILSDSSRRMLCLQNCRRSCDTNGLHDMDVLGLDWGEVSPDLVLLPPLHAILGSDLFYQPEDFEDVLVTAAFLLRRHRGAEFWTTYQVRSCDWSLESLLHRWRLKCVHVELDTFGANGSELAGSALPGRHSVQMMVITLQTNAGH